MTDRTQALALRAVVETDLPIFFQHQLDPESVRMAGGFSREDWTVFLAHWRTTVLGNPVSRARTIVWNGRPAGYVASWSQDAQRLIAYWIGREYWGRGIATASLGVFLQEELTRPLHAHVATHNVGSARVLEKCGFLRVGGETTAEDGVEEFLYRLDEARASTGSGS
jgi:RimJ/RimL family protein N-acetyltransferase